MNEFNEELVKFIEETVKKSVDKHTAEVIEETVKKVLGKYCAETNNQIELLTTAINTLMSFLIYKGVVNRAELQSAMDEALGKKAAEWNAENFGDKSEDKKIIFLNSCVVVKN